MEHNPQRATDEATVIQELRSLFRDTGGTGHGRLTVEVRDDRVQLIEPARKVRVDRK